MNERIQKLVKQATYQVYDSRTGLMDKFDKEKFVQLLVQECADYVDSAVSNGGVDGRSLKEHFGVE